MKKSTVLKIGFFLGLCASAAQGQVFNLHEVGQQGFAFYAGYNVLAFGQGAAHDPGNNIWNGFGNGQGPGNGWCFGGPHPDDQLLPGNPGNPYAWNHSGFASGPALFSPTAAAGGSGEPTAGNATSSGAHSPITIPTMVYYQDNGSALGTNSYVRTNVAAFIFSGAAIVNSTHPGVGTDVNPLGLITLSNVPPGNYDLYLYAANFDGTRGASFNTSSGNPSNGVTVVVNPYPTNSFGPLTNFIFGTNYTVFNNVFPLPDSTISVTWGAVANPISSLSGEGDFNGLQLVPAQGVDAGPLINRQPTDATFSQGTTASLSAVVSGYPAVAYQWYEGAPPGSQVSGQTSNTMTFPNAQASQSGNYFVVANNVHGAVTSSVVSLTIAAAPIIVGQSSTNSLILYSGHNNFGMSVSTFGQAPLVYYWRANGVTQARTTNVTSVVFSNITASATYDCIVSNSYATATNNPMSVTIIPQPTTPYQTALLALNPYAYWPLTESVAGTIYDYIAGNNGTSQGGAGAGFAGPTAGFGNNSTCFNFDGTGYIDVPGAPINLTGPLSLVAWTSSGGSGFQTTAGKGDSSYRLDQEGNGTAHFADGSGPDAVGGYSLKNGGVWHQVVGTFDAATTNIYLYVDGVRVDTRHAGNMPGSSFDFLIADAPDHTDRKFAGNIAHVALFNYALSASQVQTLYNAGQIPPFIVTDVNSVNGYVGGNATFAVVAKGAPTLTYQWTGPGGVITGATNSTLLVTNLNSTGTPANSGPGNYYCTITNPYGSTNSGLGVLSVSSSSPFFIQDLPVSTYAIAGNPVVLSVQVGGNSPLTNQWYNGSTALHDGDRGGRISGSTSLSLGIANVQQSDAGTYDVAVTNGIAPYFAVSSSSQLIVENEPLFNGGGGGWALNSNGGLPTFASDVLTLTDGNGGEVRTAWFTVPMYIGSFRAGFTYMAQAGNGGGFADGVTFCIQNDPAGTAARGGGGGELGYAGINNSAALAVDLFNARGYQFVTGGTDPSSTGAYVVTAPTVDTGSGHPISVSLVYDGNNLALTLKDTTTLGTFRTNIVVGSIPNIVGGKTALIGFTGATGGVASTQTITAFSFVPVPVLTVARNGAGVVLTWPTGVGGYVLQHNSGLTSAGWSTLNGPYNIVGSNFQVTITPATGTQFYRLNVSLP